MKENKPKTALYIVLFFFGLLLFGLLAKGCANKAADSFIKSFEPYDVSDR